MHEEQLNKMYDKAEPAKLVEMLTKADLLDAQSADLEHQATDIKTNIKETISRRLKADEPDKNDSYFEDQAKELGKQWQLMSASMIKVKRSIPAKGFHSKIDLYVNCTYGFKEYKRFSGWSPFSYPRAGQVRHDDQGNIGNEKFDWADGKLFIKTYNDEKEVLNFAALYKIPQFDHEKIAALSQLTQDYLQLLISWKNFYATVDYSRAEDIKTLLGFGTYSSDDKIDYRKLIKRLPELTAFKNSITKNLEAQRDRCQPMVDKWKEINKNFVVFNELAKRNLNI